MATYTQAIWKDALVTLSSNTSTGVPFRIRVTESGNAVTIFEGTCWPRPGSTKAIVKVNDICADYLTRTFPLEGNDWYEATFTIQAYLSGSWTTIDTITFTRDWSYDRAFAETIDIPVAPVTEYLHPDGYLPIFSDTGQFRAHIISGDFNEDFSLDFASASWYVDYSRDGYTHFLDLTDYEGWTKITANGKTYLPAPMCGGFVLYYINAFGGWDTLPVRGRVVKSDAVTPYNLDKAYTNNADYHRGTETYVNEIKAKYRLTIGPLTSDQSARMHHLLGSTYVYLHDIERGRLYSVVLNNPGGERKERKGALHTYEIEATLAQDRTRR